MLFIGHQLVTSCIMFLWQAHFAKYLFPPVLLPNLSPISSISSSNCFPLFWHRLSRPQCSHRIKSILSAVSSHRASLAMSGLIPHLCLSLCSMKLTLWMLPKIPSTFFLYCYISHLLSLSPVSTLCFSIYPSVHPTLLWIIHMYPVPAQCGLNVSSLPITAILWLPW